MLNWENISNQNIHYNTLYKSLVFTFRDCVCVDNCYKPTFSKILIYKSTRKINYHFVIIICFTVYNIFSKLIVKVSEYNVKMLGAIEKNK